MAKTVAKSGHTVIGRKAVSISPNDSLKVPETF